MFQFATKFAPRKEKIRRARDAGFQAGEFWLKKKHLDKVEKAIKAGAAFDFTYVPHFPNKDSLNWEHLEAFVRLYEELDCSVAVIHKPMLRSYGKRLQKLAGGSLTLAVENGRQKGDDFWKWASRNECLTLDVEHLWKFTLADCSFEQFEDVLDEFIALHGNKIRHVHMPGYTPGSAEHSPSYMNPDFARTVWRRLRDLEFHGLAVSELNREFQTSQHLSKDVILYQRWLRESDRSSSLETAEPLSAL